LRKQFFGNRTRAQCAVCGIVDDKLVFDVDHIIPKCFEGPDKPWNLWTLCLKHHRIKSVKEKTFLNTNERRCWACGCIYSKYFQVHPFWCLNCKNSCEKYNILRERVAKMITTDLK
jgi:HNH endonuclease